jgi:ubiquinone/menaquinone biosynthesis C-methylase UbiE
MADPSEDSPLLGRAFQRGTVDDPAVALMVRILDFQDQAPPIRRLRDWALARAAVRRGEQVVDIGSGTGTMSRELAALVGPEGSVTGVEPNPVLRTLAEERSDGTEVTFVDGSADALPFPDASLDFVWCERVLQHLDDAPAALQEMARVLRPGGRALVLDADHGSNVESDLSRHVETALQEAFMSRVPNPYAARHVPRQAMAAGFTLDPDIGSSALLFPQDVLEEAARLRQAGAAAVADGTLSVDEVVTALAAQQEAARKGWAFSAVTVFAFVLRKPGE